ncbi:alpha/beta fold hydrolase [Pelagovum sp. HNIBRBA483]|uniref:alpha/beta fold hydrolase n=1 Tax=Pelagovum sp. HNIBRBA483 TaxID=3233341 RepID=UPI0034A42F2A
MIWTTRQRSEAVGQPAINTGSGQPVLLIHGVGLRAEAWNPQIDALAVRYHVTAVDLLGHGAAPLPSNPLALVDYTDAIAAGITAPALVIGHSMGAMVVLDLATRYPHLVRGVAALNAVFERPPEAARAVKARAAQLDGITTADPEGTLQRWFGSTTSPERTACQDWLTSVDPAAYRAAYRVFAQANGPSRRTLQSLHCPTLFMTGADEPNSTPAMSQAMADLAPHGRALILDDAAHMMPMTHAAQVSAALLAFAEEVLP